MYKIHQTTKKILHILYRPSLTRYTSSIMTKIPKKTIQKEALNAHKKLAGKIEIRSKGTIKNMHDLSVYYTPGVGAVSQYVADNPAKARDYTIIKNTIAVISDGSAVLGLGNIGAHGALPVMEGKAMIFKNFAGIDAYPIVLATQDVEEIITTIKNISPTFGGINLEDISAPRCFEIEDRLKKELNIPVMHDDQHGTAIVVLAGLINATKVVGKSMKKMRFAVIGAGAAGTAITKLLLLHGIDDIIMTDSKGIITEKRKDLQGYKIELAKITNKANLKGGATEAIAGADVVIGVSGPRNITPTHIKSMAEKAIVFALANPIPEILPDKAKQVGAAVIATGRSDFPNQINNALVFPGVFKGALDNKVKTITDEMKLKVAKNLAQLVKKPTARKIIPTMFNANVVITVAKAIK